MEAAARGWGRVAPGLGEAWVAAGWAAPATAVVGMEARAQAVPAEQVREVQAQADQERAEEGWAEGWAGMEEGRAVEPAATEVGMVAWGAETVLAAALVKAAAAMAARVMATSAVGVLGKVAWGRVETAETAGDWAAQVRADSGLEETAQAALGLAAPGLEAAARERVGMVVGGLEDPDWAGQGSEAQGWVGMARLVLGWVVQGLAAPG